MRQILACGAGALALSAGAGAAAQERSTSAAEPAPVNNALSLSAGVSRWSGDFGAPTETQISAGLLNARYAMGDLRLTASLPYMRIKSAGTVFTGIGATPLIVAPTIPMGARVRKGWGDLTLGAAYAIPVGRASGLDLEVNGRVKLATASAASGVSTGQTDYAFGGEVSQRIGPLVPFAAVSYRVFGDPPGWNLRNGFATSVGASYGFASGITAVVSYDYSASASRFIVDSHELVGGISIPLASDRLRLTGFVSKGLSNGAPDVSGGLSIAAKL